MSDIFYLLPAKWRRVLYAVAATVAVLAAAWQVAEGDLVRAAGYVAGALVAELARSNVQMPKQHSPAGAQSVDDGVE